MNSYLAHLSSKHILILFFSLDRETPGLGMESRMLTTAMLTAVCLKIFCKLLKSNNL